MRISQLVDNDYHSILEDKAFIRQFSLLISLIIAISLFLIYYSVDRIDRLSLPVWGTQVQKQPASLGEVEKQLNGNVISLEVLEDDFNDLAEMDLRELKMVQQDAVQSQKKTAVSAAPLAGKSSSAKKAVIQITSAPLTKSTRRTKTTSIKTLRKKFYATNDVRYAIAIAERLLEGKKYTHALKWSLIANELAPESAKSWLLFAKTKLKMGKKQDAINVLEAYLKTYDSPKVSRFLKKIKSS